MVYNLLEKYGYTNQEIKKIMKTPCIRYLDEELLYKNIENNIAKLLNLRYSENKIMIMIKKAPSILSISMDNIDKKFENMVNLGYKEEEVIVITTLLPQIFTINIENINQKIKDLMSLGYNKKQVLKMTINLPALYSCNIENIRPKFTYLKEISIEEKILDDTKILMQSVELDYARNEYLQNERNITISYLNYRLLFSGNKKFEKRFKITKEKLLEKYEYQKCKIVGR